MMIIGGGSGNDLNASGFSVTNLYPCLDDALSSVPVEPSAPDDDSDEDNENVVLPSYEDVISGKV